MVRRLPKNRVVGIKQTLKALKNNEVSKLYVAKNAEKKVIAPVVNLANENSIEIEYIDTMRELGKLCGIDVGAASVAMLKD